MWKFDSNVIKEVWSHPQVLIRPRRHRRLRRPLRHRIRGRFAALLCSFNGKLGFMMIYPYIWWSFHHGFPAVDFPLNRFMVIYVGDFSLFHNVPRANPPFGSIWRWGMKWNPLLYDFWAENPRQITTGLLKSQASAANLIAVLISTTFRWEASCLRSYLLGWRLEKKKSRWMLEVGSQTFLMLILICQLRRGYVSRSFKISPLRKVFHLFLVLSCR